MNSPTIDLREVDSPFVKQRWIQNIIDKCDKGEIVTYECQDEDHYKCPSNIPNHNCVKERVSSCGYSHKLPPQYCPPENNYNPHEVVQVYDRSDPNNVFLASREVIDDANKKLPYPNFIIRGSKDDISNYERFTMSYPHPSNHDYEI